VPENVGAVFIVPLLGAASAVTEHYRVRTVVHTPANPPLVVDGVALLSTGRPPKLLPGVGQLASQKARVADRVRRLTDLFKIPASR
jgi:hypothetical protein